MRPPLLVLGALPTTSSCPMPRLRVWAGVRCPPEAAGQPGLSWTLCNQVPCIANTCATTAQSRQRPVQASPGPTSLPLPLGPAESQTLPSSQGLFSAACLPGPPVWPVVWSQLTVLSPMAIPTLGRPSMGLGWDRLTRQAPPVLWASPPAPSRWEGCPVPPVPEQTWQSVEGGGSLSQPCPQQGCTPAWAPQTGQMGCPCPPSPPVRLGLAPSIL